MQRRQELQHFYIVSELIECKKVVDIEYFQVEYFLGYAG